LTQVRFVAGIGRKPASKRHVGEAGHDVKRRVRFLGLRLHSQVVVVPNFKAVHLNPFVSFISKIPGSKINLSKGGKVH
jgi:hypothetical protein